MGDNRNKTLTFLSFCSVFYSLNEVACSIDYSPTGVGTTDYRVLRRSSWFVDKTMLLDEFSRQEKFVYLFTYPCRWGKTLNLRMVELYFSHLEASKNRLLYEKTNITKCKNCKRVQELQGKLPVISLDFKDIEETSYTKKKFLESMKKMIATTDKRHAYLKEFIEEKSGKNSEQLNRFNDYCSSYATDYILRTQEIRKLEGKIEESNRLIAIHTLLIDNNQQRIHEKEKPYLRFQNQHSEEIVELRRMKNISIAEKNERMKAINSFHEPVLKKTRVDKSTLRKFQKELENLKTSRDLLKKEIDEIKSKELNRLEDQVVESVEFLATMLHEATGRKSIVLIDEYDAPVNKAPKTTLRHILPVLTKFMGKTFKSKSQSHNKNVECFVYFGVVTGILRVAKESMFSKVNNLCEFNMLNNPMMEYYGFTDLEVSRLMQIFKEEYPKETLTEKDLKYWYDGYRIIKDYKTANIHALSREFYCPWAIVRALDDKKTANYFTQSGTMVELNGVIMSPIMQPVIINLIRNNTEPMTMDELGFTREDLENLRRLSDITREFTEKYKTLTLRFLFATGYLTLAIDEKDLSVTGVKAANQEIRKEFLKIFLSYYAPEIGINMQILNAASDAFNYVFESGDLTDFRMRYQELLEACPVFTEDKHGKGLFYNQHNCQVLMEMVDVNLFLKARRPGDFQSGELTYRRKAGDIRRSDSIYYREDIKTAIVFEMRTNGTASKALRDAQDKYSEYLDGFSGIQRKIFIGVYVGKDKKVHMEIVVKPNQKSKNPDLLSAGQPK